MKKPSIRKNNPSRYLVAVIVVCLLVLLVASVFRGRHTKSAITPSPSNSASPEATTAALGAGKPSARGSEPTLSPVATASSQPSSSSAIIKPIGQLLNKTRISLSAAADDGQHNASMVSTVLTATPGSTNTIIATSSDGTKISLGSPVTADSNGQGSEVQWNAKTAGLKPGTWKIQILSQLNGGSALSDAEQLTVEG